MKNAIQPAIKGGRFDAQLSRFRVDGVSDAFSCELHLPDSIRVGRHRSLAEPDSFDVTVEFTNLAVTDPLRVWYVELELPAGIELDPSTQSTQIRPVPEILGPGMRGAVTWHLRVRRHGLSEGTRIRARVYYAEPGVAAECPPGYGSCEKELDVRYYEEDEPRLACMLGLPDTLRMMPDESAPVRFTVPYRAYTLGGDTARISSVTFAVGRGMGVRLLSSGRKVGRTLLPGDTLLLHWELEAERRLDFRTVNIRAVAEDGWAYPLSVCEDSMTIAPVALHCRLGGDAEATYDRESGTLDHDSLRVTLELTNPADTSQGEITAFFDLSAAAHLQLRPGSPTLLGPFGMDADTVRRDTWWLELKQPVTDYCTDTVTVRFRHSGDSMWQECIWLIDLRVFDEHLACSIVAPADIDAPEVLSGDPVALTCTMTNAGTVPQDVDRYELGIAPGSGVTTGDPLTRAGGTIDPGNDMSLAWNLRALALRDARTERFTVSAYDAEDEILTTCSHEMQIAGVDGLVCSLGSVDTVRFDRTAVRYDPDPTAVLLTLENLLDTGETNIESRLDLTQAPRLALAASETASKTISVIDSHATANLTWQLIPQPAPQAESQEIVVRYKSEQMDTWQECRVTVFIEAWPEEETVACATGGHDSLYADSHYEQFIPDPLHVSYTVTNTGTVALTGCGASIILPPEFALVGTDSTQRFTAPEYANQPGGPVPEGTILPNTSCTRWWKITPTQAIADTAPKLIRWQWTSDQQGEQSGCDHTMHIIPENPQSIVLTPLHLSFEAERGGALPSEQHVQLWTGGGLVMPWTAQPSEWWLDAQPVNGSGSTQITVQPSSTMLDVGAHGTEILLAATPVNRRVAVTYVIRKSTGIGEPPAPGTLTLDAWPQPVPSGTRLHVRIGGTSGGRHSSKTCHLTLHDLLGRERIAQTVESNRSMTIDLDAAQLNAGVYLLRVVSEDGAQAVRMISVVR